MKIGKLPLIIKEVLAYRRRTRLDYILSKVIITNSMKVIDIGCGVDGRSFSDHVPQNWEITGVDILPAIQVRHRHTGFSYIQQDAQDLSRFKDQEFDLAVSIGMLEHITQEAAFKRIVSEIRRVAKQYIVIVPYKYCWLEPHYAIPFFPLLPYPMKQFIIKIFNLNNQREAVIRDSGYIAKYIRWLSNAQYRAEFSGSKIYLLPTLETIAITTKSQTNTKKSA